MQIDKSQFFFLNKKGLKIEGKREKEKGKVEMSKKVEPENNKGNVALEGGKQKGTMQKGTTLVTF